MSKDDEYDYLFKGEQSIYTFIKTVYINVPEVGLMHKKWDVEGFEIIKLLLACCIPFQWTPFFF